MYIIKFPLIWFFLFCFVGLCIHWLGEKMGPSSGTCFKRSYFLVRKLLPSRLKNGQEIYFILIKKDISRGADNNSRTLHVFCKFSMSALLHPLLQIRTQQWLCWVSVYIGVTGLDLWSQRLKRTVMSNEIAFCFSGKIDL